MDLCVFPVEIIDQIARQSHAREIYILCLMCKATYQRIRSAILASPHTESFRIKYDTFMYESVDHYWKGIYDKYVPVSEVRRACAAGDKIAQGILARSYGWPNGFAISIDYGHGIYRIKCDACKCSRICVWLYKYHAASETTGDKITAIPICNNCYSITSYLKDRDVMVEMACDRYGLPDDEISNAANAMVYFNVIGPNLNVGERAAKLISYKSGIPIQKFDL